MPTLVVDAEVPGREILRWRCISLRFPVGVLVAAAAPQGLRPEPRVRSKLLGPPRIIGLVAAAFMVGLIPAAYALGPAPGETYFGLAVTLFLFPAAAIS